MSKAVTQQVQLGKTNLLLEENNGGTVREVMGGIAQHFVEKLFGWSNRVWDIAIIMLQPGHFSETSSQGGAAFDTQLLLSFCIPLFRLNKTTNCPVHSIWTLQLHEVRGNRDDDLLGVRNTARYILIMLAQEDCITMAKYDERRHAQLF